MDLAQIDALIEKQAPPTTSVDLCLRGDLQARWEELDRELKKETGAGATKLSGFSDRASQLAKEIEALEAEMKAAVVTFTLQGLGRAAWRELEAEHPARKDHDVDTFYGFNTDTIFDSALPLSIVSPELDADRVAKIADKLTAGQFEKLALAILRLNKQDSEAPFSQAASLITRATGVMSKRPPASESHTNGSRGGSRKRSRSTSTKTGS